MNKEVSIFLKHVSRRLQWVTSQEKVILIFTSGRSSPFFICNTFFQMSKRNQLLETQSLLLQSLRLYNKFRTFYRTLVNHTLTFSIYERSCLTRKLEDHHLSRVRSCFFNIFSVIFQTSSSEMIRLY